MAMIRTLNGRKLNNCNAVFDGYRLSMVYCNITNNPLGKKVDRSPLNIYVGDLVHPPCPGLLLC